MSDRCATCGGAATLLVAEGAKPYGLCSACMDRAHPELGLGRFRKQFIRPREAIGKCPFCGWTQEQVDKLGLAGCPLCYEALDVSMASA